MSEITEQDGAVRRMPETLAIALLWTLCGLAFVSITTATTGVVMFLCGESGFLIKVGGVMYVADIALGLLIGIVCRTIGVEPEPKEMLP